MPDPRNVPPRPRAAAASSPAPGCRVDARGSSTRRGARRRRGDGASPTAYVGDRLMVAKGDRLDDQVAALAAGRRGRWAGRCRLDREPAKARGLPLGVRTVQISHGESDGRSRSRTRGTCCRRRAARARTWPSSRGGARPRGVDPPVDARSPSTSRTPRTRTRGSSPTRSRCPTPSRCRTPTARPAVSAGLWRATATRASGGRQPIAYVGPTADPVPDSAIKGRRPVVAMLDTGCYPHFWFDGRGGRRTSSSTATRIGYTDPTTDPELHGDLTGPFDGVGRPDRRARHLHRRAGPPGVPGRPDPVVARHPGRRSRWSSRSG